jgi:hypothetical protein
VEPTVDSCRLHLEICYAISMSLFVVSLRRQLTCDVPCDKIEGLRDNIKGTCCIVVNTRTQGNIFSDWLCWSLCCALYCHKGRSVAASDPIFKNAWKSQYSQILLILFLKITANCYNYPTSPEQLLWLVDTLSRSAVDGIMTSLRAVKSAVRIPCIGNK